MGPLRLNPQVHPRSQGMGVVVCESCVYPTDYVSMRNGTR